MNTRPVHPAPSADVLARMSGPHGGAEPDESEPRQRIAVRLQGGSIDEGSADERSADGLVRLLDALERVRPVRFLQIPHGPSQDLREIAAEVVVGPVEPPQAPGVVPRLVIAPSGRRRCVDPRPQGSQTPIALTHDALLARPLRGRTIPDQTTVSESTLAPSAGARALAGVDRRCLWWHVGKGAEWQDVSVCELAELRPGETLRDHLQAGRFMGLLPLLRFIDHVLGIEGGWTPPVLRASFVVDDPNLHRPRYGYIDYEDLIAHAAQHRYHVGLATVPLDNWLIDRRAAALIGGNASVVSLLMHGNDHSSRELGRLRDDHQAELAIAQAQRRIAKLERRSGVEVQRVMAPPHGACSENALRAMLRLGIEAACISRPYPWRDGLPSPTPLAGWLPADLVAGGMPVLPRLSLSAAREDLALRALLGQPLILYGHHWDFASGLDVLAQAADEINGLGEVQWGPLGWVARSNYATRRVAETLFVRMHARTVSVPTPADVAALRIIVDVPFGACAWRGLTVGDRDVGLSFDNGQGVSEPVAVQSAGELQLRLLDDRPLDPAGVPSPGVKPWPLLRRLLVEGRDRIQPRL
jgi:hypothetical protein